MKLKSLNIMVNELCNNKCTSCNIWVLPNKQEIDPEKLKLLLKTEQFSEVEDVSITGGEPILHHNIEAIMNSLEVLPNLKMVFFNTNGTATKKIISLMHDLKGKFQALYLCISIEGEKEVHNHIRGIPSYDLVMQTITESSKLIDGSFKVILSTTIQHLNAKKESIEHVINMSKENSCTFTYRFMDIGEYYGNFEKDNQVLSKEEKIKISAMIKELYGDDPYLKYQHTYLLSKSNPLMQDTSGKIVCRAGEVFAFLNAKSEFKPCIYSNRTIGDINSGITEVPKDLGKYEPCPCCTECTIYPMMNYAK